MASEKVAKPRAANAGVVPTASRRYTALQSPIAPSARRAQKLKAPSPRSAAGGQTKTELVAARGFDGKRLDFAIAIATSESTATSVTCEGAFSPPAMASAAPPAPTSPPT